MLLVDACDRHGIALKRESSPNQPEQDLPLEPTRTLGLHLHS